MNLHFTDALVNFHGDRLDAIGLGWGVKRLRYFWFFRESDAKYRARLTAVIKDATA